MTMNLDPLTRVSLPPSSIPFANMFVTHRRSSKHCSTSHRKARHAKLTVGSIGWMIHTVSIMCRKTRTRYRSRPRLRSTSYCLNASSATETNCRTLNSLKGTSLTPSISSLIALATITLFLLNTSTAIATAIPLGVSPISTTTPTNFTSSIQASTKPTCKIGLLMPALFRNFTSYTDDASKPVTLWYAQSLVDIVQAGLDEGVRVLSATHAGESTKKKGQSSGEASYPGLTCNVEIEWRDGGWCDEKSALGQAVALHMDHNIKVIVGPPCHKSLRVVGLLGSYWSIPVITWEPVLRKVVGDKSYDGVISTYGAFEDFAQSAVAIIRHLQWTKIAILLEDTPLCTPLIEELGRGMLDGNLATEADKVVLRQDNTSAVREHLRRIKGLTRTIVTCTQRTTMENVLLEAQDLGMTTGYYGFLHLSFDVRPMTSNTSSDRPSPLNVVLQLGQFHGGLGGRGEHEEEKAEEGRSLNRSRVSRNNAGGAQYRHVALNSQEMLYPYLHDAIVVATVASQRDTKEASSRNFSIASPYELHTGAIEFDEQGIRKAKFSLVQRQSGEGKMVGVAEIGANQNVTWLNDIMWDGGPVPVSDITCRGNDSCMDVAGIIAGVTMGVFTVCLLVTLTGYFYRKHRRRLAAAKKDWLVDDRDVKRRRAKLPMSNGFTSGPGSNMETVKRLVRMETRGTLGLGSNCSLDKNMLYAPIGNYKDMVVAVKHVRWTHVQMGKREMLEDLTTAKELSHDNVNQFVGAHVSTEPGSSYVLFRYCSKGSLQDVLANEDIKLDWMFKLSFALDLARGIEYIHKTALRSHGNLKSSNCVIDSRWVLKVTDYGAITSYRKPGAEDDQDNRLYFSGLIWTAPELLRMNKRPHKGTQKGDVYSFGIILQEILFRCAAYFYNYMEPEDIITLVKNETNHRCYRPVIPPDNELPPKAINLMVACWAEGPETRPDVHQIRKRVRDLNGSKRFNIMDNMLQMLESYSSNLEQLVTDRTEELEAEKRKTDSLLYQMLPPLVAEQLKSGMSVIPESYDQVSIFFSDIVGFTAIASQSRPLEVVDLLNDLYTCFDEVIARRDVYKVETIGDAYMCVSGCPRRNGNRHAGEIANMALDLISAVTHFRIRHKPEEHLNLRVGLHTGACAAGVVGRTMPRYCLFGDTVNMASRMESTGKALHIHMSSQMKDALDDLDWGFITVERGFIEVKGKGIQKTFWLAGKRNYKKPLPDSLIELQKSLEEGGMKPTSSFTTLTVGDSMFSALRKTSITVSNITVKNSPCTSDTEDICGGDGRRDTQNGSISQYGNLLEASARQHFGRKRGGNGGRAGRRTAGGGGGGFLSDDASDGDVRAKSPLALNYANTLDGRVGGSVDTDGNSNISVSSEDVLTSECNTRSENGNHVNADQRDGNKSARVVSKGRKSLGEIGNAWKTVGSSDSDSSATGVNSEKQLSRSWTPSSAVECFMVENEISLREADNHNTTKTVDADSSDKRTVLSSAKRNQSDSFEMSPMKRKRAVVSPPRLTLVEPLPKAKDHSESDFASADNRIYKEDEKGRQQSNQTGNNSNRQNNDWCNETDSDQNVRNLVKAAVKKDSACYSLADSVSDSGESANRPHENGNINHINNKRNENCVNLPLGGYGGHCTPILHVASSPVKHQPETFQDKSICTSRHHDVTSEKAGVTDSHNSVKLSLQDSSKDSNSPPQSMFTSITFVSPDHSYTTASFGIGDSELGETPAEQDHGPSADQSAPIISVQHEDARRSHCIKPLDGKTSETFSPVRTDAALSNCGDNGVQQSLSIDSDSFTRGDAENGQPLQWFGMRSVNERDHKWFPQPSGKDVMPHNHQNTSTHPALIPVHIEDCPGLTTNRNTRHFEPDFKTSPCSEQHNGVGRLSDTSVANSQTEISVAFEMDNENAHKSVTVRDNNMAAPVRSARRKHNKRRGIMNPDDLPRIEIT